MTWIRVMGMLALGVLFTSAQADPLRDRAQEAVAKLRLELTKAQTEAIATNVAEKAVETCLVTAPQLVAAGQSEGLAIGRTATRVRNPENVAKAWMSPIMESYKNTSREKPGAPTFIRISQTQMGYAEPIYTEGPCEVCHGPNVDPAVEKRIRVKYPNDQATGFVFGEFRGMFWVEIDSGAPK